jgi:uncharacterized membrane protein
MEETPKRDYTVKRIGGYLHKIIPILDEAGQIVNYVISPLMVELHPRDVMQIIVGASVLSIPVAFTQEVWDLGRSLPWANIAALGLVSLGFIALYVYLNFFREQLRGRVFGYIQRVAAIYLLSLVVVGLLLTIIGQAPWRADFALAIKRLIIVSFPASMSAAVTDSLR